MSARIYELNMDSEEKEPITEVAEYSVDPKKALVNYIMQRQNNLNTWSYPEIIEGMYQGTHGSWYYDDISNNVIIGAHIM